MLTIALIVFGFAALGGVVLALHVLRDKLAPWVVSVLHAVVGAGGIVLLLLAVIEGNGGELAVIALAGFVAAALGGFYLALKHLRQKIPPKIIVVLHASLAIVAFVGLLAALLDV